MRLHLKLEQDNGTSLIEHKSLADWSDLLPASSGFAFLRTKLLLAELKDSTVSLSGLRLPLPSGTIALCRTRRPDVLMVLFHQRWRLDDGRHSGSSLLTVIYWNPRDFFPCFAKVGVFECLPDQSD